MAKMSFLVNDAREGSNWLEKAIQAYPDDPEAYIIQGDLLLQRQSRNPARAMYEKGLELVTTLEQNATRNKHLTIRALSGLGLVANGNEDWTASQNYLSRWLQLEPSNVIAKERMAYVLFRQGKAEEAYATFNEVYSQDPTRTRHEVAMARLYDSVNKDKNRARRLMELAQERDAKSPQPNLNTQVAVAEWALENGNISLAQKASAAADQIDQESLESKLIGALVALHQDQKDTAVSLFEAAHLQSPSNAVAMNHLALLLVERPNQQDRRRALEFAQVCARVYSTYDQRFAREAAITLAWVLHRLDRTPDALRILSRVLEQQGTVDSTSLYLAARILHDVEQDNVARQILDAILENESGTHFLYRQEALKLRAELAPANQ